MKEWRSKGTKTDMRHETRTHGTSPAIRIIVLDVNRVLTPAKERKRQMGKTQQNWTWLEYILLRSSATREAEKAYEQQMHLEEMTQDKDILQWKMYLLASGVMELIPIYSLDDIQQRYLYL